MKAIVIERHGDPSVLHLVDVALPLPGPGEMIVRVRSTNVNFRDVQERRGSYAARTTLPLVPGLEGSGTIAALGDCVTGLAVGKQVVALAARGSYAELMPASAVLTYALPDDVTDERVAGLTAAVTADNALSLPGHAVEGRTVAVHSAAGGVDLVLNSVGGDTVTRDLSATAEFGAVVVFGQSSGASGRVPPDALHKGSRALLGYSSGHLRQRQAEQLRATVERVLRRISDGTLSIRVGARFALAEAAQAHALVERGTSTGKVALTVSS